MSSLLERLRWRWYGVRRWWRGYAEWLRASPAVGTIAVACAVVFLAQSVAMRLEFPPGILLGNILVSVFGLHWPLLAKGCFWQPVSYAFLHGSLMHLALNMFTLIFFGPAVEGLIGSRRFWGLYLLGAVVGGVGWMIFNWLEPSFWLTLQKLPGDYWMELAQRWAEQQPIGEFGVCIGASAAVFAPARRLTLLLFFVIPLNMSARTLAVVLMVATVVLMVVGWGQVAHSAHLVGGVTGWLMGRRWRKRWLRG